MKLNVKTLKGTSFEIEAAAEASVRHLPFPYPTLLPLVSLQSERLRAIIGRFAGDGVRFCCDRARGVRRLFCREGFDLNLGFRVVFSAQRVGLGW
jgi:hypothetical protein